MFVHAKLSKKKARCRKCLLKQCSIPLPHQETARSFRSPLILRLTFEEDDNNKATKGAERTSFSSKHILE